MSECQVRQSPPTYLYRNLSAAPPYGGHGQTARDTLRLLLRRRLRVARVTP